MLDSRRLADTLEMGSIRWRWDRLRWDRSSRHHRNNPVMKVWGLVTQPNVICRFNRTTHPMVRGRIIPVDRPEDLDGIAVRYNKDVTLSFGRGQVLEKIDHSSCDTPNGFCAPSRVVRTERIVLPDLSVIFRRGELEVTKISFTKSTVQRHTHPKVFTNQLGRFCRPEKVG